MPAPPAPTSVPAPTLRAALAAAAAAVLLAGCGIAESDTDRLSRKVAAGSVDTVDSVDAVDAVDDAVDGVDTSASRPPGAPGPAPTATPDPTRSPAPEAALLRNPARQVRPAIAPAHGATVGIGQPVSLVFKGQKVDPALRAGIEGRVRIKTSTGVVGAWHWAEAKGDTYLHFRPREYWPAGTKVTLDARLAGVRLDARTAAAGDRQLAFTVGPAMVSKVDLAAHTLTLVKDGTPLRTIPVSGGEDRFKTREGVKTILSKDGTVLMDSRTIGIPRTSPDGFYGRYEWSMRETVSGEYVHAAPDNAESFGRANVSHGCIGMSVADAKWLYERSSVGDVIEVTGTTGKPMDRFGNGYGDWNLSWDEWLKGSTLGAFKA
ncbi:L,D-transpeptidase [Streptomyces sp. NBC_01264]|uniref:L,D-transpeptidase n=1 Tax=Streptomyces sp. NBC_01264 TaxID=2903804 RepID=UPI0022552B34|nr:L,D-transpeptidase [Streptomyces sp. NBC_01264]MCX4782576.1 L,D-transpeptidase [Streptomyces sp. NBC_01264]